MPVLRSVMPSVCVTVTLALTAGCAGSIAGSSGESGGQGFAYGADQQEVTASIEGLDPVTLTYQPASSSPDDTAAPSAQAFKE